MYVVTVNFVVASEFNSEFTSAMLEQARNSIELEEGCHVFDVCGATDDACSIYLYEKYTDASAFQTHLESAHFKAFDALVAPWLISKTVSTWSVLGAFS